MTQLWSWWFLRQAVFVCEADFMLNYVKLLQWIKNSESLGQYKSRFSLLVEQMLAFASSKKLLREAKKSLQILTKLCDDILS